MSYYYPVLCILVIARVGGSRKLRANAVPAHHVPLGAEHLHFLAIAKRALRWLENSGIPTFSVR